MEDMTPDFKLLSPLGIVSIEKRNAYWKALKNVYLRSCGQ